MPPMSKLHWMQKIKDAQDAGYFIYAAALAEAFKRHLELEAYINAFNK